jgi:hypothetical protein
VQQVSLLLLSGAPGHRLLRRVSQTPHARESTWAVAHLLPNLLLPHSSSSRCPASATVSCRRLCHRELPPPTVLPPAIPRFSPSPAASFSGAGEPPTHNPKILSLLRHLHRGQPRRRRLRGAAASPAPPPSFSPLAAPFFLISGALLQLHRPPSLTGPGPSPYASLAQVRGAGVGAAEGGV